MEAQEIFDTVVRHLAKMPKRSMKGSGRDVCAYRGADGLKCAIGALLTDEECRVPLTHPNNVSSIEIGWPPFETIDDFHQSGVFSLCKYGILPERLKPHLSLLEQLQDVHDEGDNWRNDGQGPNVWEMHYELLRVAKSRNLDAKVVKEMLPPH